MAEKYTCYEEITHQAEAWQQAFERVTERTDEIRDFWREAQPDQVLFTGCTSPYYAGVSAAIGLEQQLGISVRAVPCNEFIQFPDAYLTRKANPVMIVLSRSGLTTEALWMVEEFNKKHPGRTILLSPRENSPLSRLTRLNIHFPKGDDAALPQTRSLSSMYMAALTLNAIISGFDADLDDLRAAPEAFTSILQNAEPVVREVIESRQISRVFFLGAGPLYGIVREATLKVMEMSFVPTFCYPFLESRHGPRSLMDANTLVLGLYSQAGRGLEAPVMEEYSQKLGVVSLAAVPDNSWETGALNNVVSTGVSWDDRIQGLAYLPIVQLAAYYLAIQQGVNPDLSRNTTSFIEIVRP
ncbi:MAG: hypothetical protein B6D39_08035 [Anaerolineae bacterium UTCFX2]|jgi:glucosamine--fructose-6-phosphate aminotransferase (isomerizing)|nr:SIS domain-containing protein [Anaerolineales bacterium]OQY90483.1 MAG: hypothetical protein B6D39_08035 [Anaerolineae bacterium UTCFX2]